MRYLLLILNSESGKWYVADQSEDPEDLLKSGKAAIDADPMVVYRLIDIDAK